MHMFRNSIQINFIYAAPVHNNLKERKYSEGRAQQSELTSASSQIPRELALGNGGKENHPFNIQRPPARPCSGNGSHLLQPVAG